MFSIIFKTRFNYNEICIRFYKWTIPNVLVLLNNVATFHFKLKAFLLSLV